jgi:hypothetical protein
MFNVGIIARGPFGLAVPPDPLGVLRDKWIFMRGSSAGLDNRLWYCDDITAPVWVGPFTRSSPININTATRGMIWQDGTLLATNGTSYEIIDAAPVGGSIATTSFTGPTCTRIRYIDGVTITSRNNAGTTYAVSTDKFLTWANQAVPFPTTRTDDICKVDGKWLLKGVDSSSGHERGTSTASEPLAGTWTTYRQGVGFCSTLVSSGTAAVLMTNTGAFSRTVNGTTWSTIASLGGTGSVSRCSAYDPINDVMLLAYSESSSPLRRGLSDGTAWSAISVGTTATAQQAMYARGVFAAVIYTGGVSGSEKIYVSTDAGASFSLVSQPVAGGVCVLAFAGTP